MLAEIGDRLIVQLDDRKLLLGQEAGEHSGARTDLYDALVTSMGKGIRDLTRDVLIAEEMLTQMFLWTYQRLLLVNHFEQSTKCGEFALVPFGMFFLQARSLLNLILV